MVPAGEMDQRIVISARADVEDGYGGVAETTWTPVVSCWAKAKPVKATEAETHGGLRVVSVALFTFWKPAAALDETMRIAWDGRDYDIRDIRPKGARQAQIEVVGECGAGV